MLSALLVSGLLLFPEPGRVVERHVRVQVFLHVLALLGHARVSSLTHKGTSDFV